MAACQYNETGVAVSNASAPKRSRSGPSQQRRPATSKKVPKVRADRLLTDRGLLKSREDARASILAGEVFAAGQRVEKAGQLLPADVELRVASRPRFVGRGGEKLEGALDALGLDPRGWTALDVGASTGGFTDCLLQRGAARVYAVDVGRGQLADRLRSDPRVVSMERTNAHHPFDLPEEVDLLVADVSFISLRLVLPASLAHLRAGGQALVLVKPQFEAGRREVGRGGVVRDPAVHARTVGAFCLWAIGEGLRLLGVRASPLEGEAGNREFFVLLRKLRAAAQDDGRARPPGVGGGHAPK